MPIKLCQRSLNPVPSGAPILFPDQVANLGMWIRFDADVSFEETGLANPAEDGDPLASFQFKQDSAWSWSVGTASVRPTWRSGYVQGKPACQFDGVDDNITITAANPVASEFVTVSTKYMIFVLRPVDSTTNNTTALYQNSPIMDNGTWFGLFLAHSPLRIIAYNWDGNADTVSGNVTSGNWVYVEYEHAGGNLTLRINNISQGTVASGNTSNNLTAIKPAFMANGNGKVEGDLAEVIAYSVIPTSDEKTKLRNYVSQRYGIG